MRFRPLEWLTLGVALSFVVLSGVAALPRLYLVRIAWLVLALILMLLLVWSGVHAAMYWPRQRWRALVPLLLALGGCAGRYPARALGTTVRDRRFVRALPAYAQVVEGYRTGVVAPGELSLAELPPALRGCCYRIVGVRDKAGAWIVESWEERRFPVHHDAWMYYDGDSLRAVVREREWYAGYRVAPHWYRVAD